MVDLAIGLIFFCFFMCFHIVSFRLRWVRLEHSFLLLFFLFWFVLLIVTLMHYGQMVRTDFKHWTGVLGISAPISSAALYCLLAFWYVAECTVIQHESPSLTVIRFISTCPEKQASYADLLTLFSNDELIRPRLDDLVRHGHVAFDGHRYSLLRRGILITKVATGYRKLLGRGAGG